MLSNLRYENSLWNNGIEIVAGVDEVGRGAIAGPLVAAAVVWPKTIITSSNELITKIRDSKKVTKRNREILSEFIKENCLHYSIIEISSSQIDERGVGVCNIQALQDAALQIENVEHVLVDHHKIFTGFEKPDTTSITEGETHSLSIAAASIIAKVYRDNLMGTKYNDMYPEYEFAKHVGYGTKGHYVKLNSHGLTPIHRRSFLKNFTKF